MRKAMTGVSAMCLALAGCGQPGGNGSHVADEAADVSMVMPGMAPAPADAPPSRQASPTVTATAPSIAYAYRFTLELPADRTTPLMTQHERACVAAGAPVCQIIGSSSSRLGRDEVTARLEMRAIPAWVARFRAGLDGDARSVGGRVAQASTESEDLTRQLVDTEARMRALETLRDRLQQLLATRSGTLEQLLQVERELARVQGELDATRSSLTVMRTRVQTSRLDVTYQAAGQLAPDSAMRPVQDALGAAAYVFMSAVGALILLIAGALPVIVVLAPLIWLSLRWRKRQTARRLERRRAEKERLESESADGASTP